MKLKITAVTSFLSTPGEIFPVPVKLNQAWPRLALTLSLHSDSALMLPVRPARLKCITLSERQLVMAGLAQASSVSSVWMAVSEHLLTTANALRNCRVTRLRVVAGNTTGRRISLQSPRTQVKLLQAVINLNLFRFKFIQQCTGC